MNSLAEFILLLGKWQRSLRISNRQSALRWTHSIPRRRSRNLNLPVSTKLSETIKKPSSRRTSLETLPCHTWRKQTCSSHAWSQKSPATERHRTSRAVPKSLCLAQRTWKMTSWKEMEKHSTTTTRRKDCLQTIRRNTRDSRSTRTTHVLLTITGLLWPVPPCLIQLHLGRLA